MRTALPFDDLVNCSDAVLKRLGYSFHRNQTQKVSEFEVYEPCSFLVRVEDMNDAFRPGGFMALGGGGGMGNSISMIFDERSPTRPYVSAFARALLETLPRKPWEGLGHISSRTSKAYWVGLSEEK